MRCCCVAALALPETLPPSHRRPLRVRGIAATYVELLRDKRFVILVLVAALGMSGLFAYIAGASFVLQGTYGLDQQAFALVFGAGAVALIGATQFNVVLLKRFSPQAITLWALAAALLAGGVFVGLSRRPMSVGWPVSWCRCGRSSAAMGLVIPNAPAVALSRHPDAAGTAAALLGAAQFGLGAAVAPLVGVLGNDELALSVVMAVSVLVALLALLAVGVSTSDDADDTAVEDARRRSGVVVPAEIRPYRQFKLRRMRARRVARRSDRLRSFVESLRTGRLRWRRAAELDTIDRSRDEVGI